MSTWQDKREGLELMYDCKKDQNHGPDTTLDGFLGQRLYIN